MKPASPRALLSEINVTPFVDVMLVLLIVFMVTAPMLDQGIPVDLPPAETSKQVSGSGLVLTLTKDHLIYLDDKVVTLKDLREQIKPLSNQPVLIRSDRNAYVSRLVELWDLCRVLGFKQVSISTLSE